MLQVSTYLEKVDGNPREVKDNALMTPLMNTVSSNNVPSFCYLFFKEKCSLNNLDS